MDIKIIWKAPGETNGSEEPEKIVPELEVEQDPQVKQIKLTNLDPVVVNLIRKMENAIREKDESLRNAVFKSKKNLESLEKVKVFVERSSRISKEKIEARDRVISALEDRINSLRFRLEVLEQAVDDKLNIIAKPSTLRNNDGGQVNLFLIGTTDNFDLCYRLPIKTKRAADVFSVPEAEILERKAAVTKIIELLANPSVLNGNCDLITASGGSAIRSKRMIWFLLNDIFKKYKFKFDDESIRNYIEYPEKLVKVRLTNEFLRNPLFLTDEDVCYINPRRKRSRIDEEKQRENKETTSTAAASTMNPCPLCNLMVEEAEMEHHIENDHSSSLTSISGENLFTPETDNNTVVDTTDNITLQFNPEQVIAVEEDESVGKVQQQERDRRRRIKEEPLEIPEAAPVIEHHPAKVKLEIDTGAKDQIVDYLQNEELDERQNESKKKKNRYERKRRLSERTKSPSVEKKSCSPSEVEKSKSRPAETAKGRWVSLETPTEEKVEGGNCKICGEESHPRTENGEIKFCPKKVKADRRKAYEDSSKNIDYLKPPPKPSFASAARRRRRDPQIAFSSRLKDVIAYIGRYQTQATQRKPLLKMKSIDDKIQANKFSTRKDFINAFERDVLQTAYENRQEKEKLNELSDLFKNEMAALDYELGALEKLINPLNSGDPKIILACLLDKIIKSEFKNKKHFWNPRYHIDLNYKARIKKPMGLELMSEKISDGHYESKEEFISDAELIRSHTAEWFGSGSTEEKMALEMVQDLKERVNEEFSTF